MKVLTALIAGLLLALLLVGCGTNERAPPQDDDDNQEQDMKSLEDAARANAARALNNPSNSLEAVQELLNALEPIQELDFKDGEEIEKTIMKMIRIKLESMLLDPGLCKKKLLDIATVSQQLGFDDFGMMALERVGKALESCGGESGMSKVSYSYVQTVDPDYDTGHTKKTATIQGTLKEWTIFGASAEGQDTFYFTDGVMEWTYEDQYGNTDVCEHITRRGSGTETLKSDRDGSFTLFDDGTYDGNVASKLVDVTVSITRAPIPPHDFTDTNDNGVDDYEEICNRVKGRNYQEKENIQVAVQGTTTNMDIITDSSNDEGTTTSWKLELPR